MVGDRQWQTLYGFSLSEPHAGGLWLNRAGTGACSYNKLLQGRGNPRGYPRRARRAVPLPAIAPVSRPRAPFDRQVSNRISCSASHLGTIMARTVSILIGHGGATACITPAFNTAIAGQKVTEIFFSWMSHHDLAKLPDTSFTNCNFVLLLERWTFYWGRINNRYIRNFTFFKSD